VGFFFWIPLLTRSIAIFTAAVLSSTFTGTSIYNAQRGLDGAVRFWFAGFQAALAARHAVNSGSNAVASPSGPPIHGIYELVFHHLLFTLLFWLSATALWIFV
jgi:hypothetical protein